MAQEEDLLAAFIEFADTFVADYDIVEFLHRLATRCVELVDVSEAGIMLTDRQGALHFVASSSERMHLIELFELQHDEGPCLDAYRTGVPVHSGTADEADARWPRFAAHARAVGFQSMSALPMRLRDDVIGALNLFSATPARLSARDQQVAQALADIATIGILQERAMDDRHVVTMQLETALQSRIVIEQAKGMVAEHNGVSVDDAFTMLRGYARGSNRLLREVAETILDGTLDPDELSASARHMRA